MEIFIIIIVSLTSVCFGLITHRPINRSAIFDLSFSQKSYQEKIDRYLGIKIEEKLPTIYSYPVKNLPSNDSPTIETVTRSIQPIPKHTRKTYKYEGYLRFNDSGTYVHRWVMEKHLERKLTALEVVHHRDGNKLNNNINNLWLFPSQKEHDAYHRKCKELYGVWHAHLPYHQFIKLSTCSA